jgi:8-hydroxy-5-deazaflavin:NADPH oxidoreductase
VASLSPARRGAADRSYLPIAGDSAPAKAAVTEFIESLGYSVVDAGPLADSWRQATGTAVGDPVRAVLEREGPAGRRGHHPRGTGHRNAVTAS